MTVNALIQRLQALVAKDGFRGDAAVTFGSDMEPVWGGIFTRQMATNRHGATLTIANILPKHG